MTTDPRGSPPVRSPSSGHHVCRIFVIGILAVLSAGIMGCAAVPNVDPYLTPVRAAPPQIVGTRGPLSSEQSRAVLERAGAVGHQLTALERHLAIEQEVAETPLVAGNRTHFLRDGENTFRTMFELIGEAQRSINLEYYILEDIESDGVMLSDLLVQKAQQGVAINILYDSFGSASTPDSFFDKLKAAGITMLSFNPVNPFKARGAWRPNQRDHRKMLVIDGRVGIIGGINLSTTYMASGPSRLGKSGAGGGGKRKAKDGASEQEKATAKTADYWRDIDLKIEGPVVAQLQTLFLEHWAAQKGPSLNDSEFFPQIAPAGDEVIRIIGSTPEHDVPRYYVTLLSAIRNADKNIYVVAAYFVPTRDERRDLTAAAKRGVDVRLLLPAKSDSGMAVAAQRSRYGAFFEAGVKIYEVTDYILHSKMVSVDGVWTVIGSSNLDQRSVIYNDEVDGVVLGKDTAEQMERLFHEDLSHARSVDPETWARRGLGERLKEFFARIIENLL